MLSLCMGEVDRSVISDVLDSKSYSVVAKKHGVSKQTVCNILRRNGYDTQLLAENRRRMVKSMYYQLECNNCGCLFWRASRHKDNKFCSRGCMGEYMKKHMKKDVSRRDIYGNKFYPAVGVKDDSGRWKTKSLSRFVVEKNLGRQLKSDEVVHHLDGNSENNDFDNLEVLSNSEHVKMTNIGKWKPINESTVVKLRQTKKMTKEEFALVE